MREILLVGHRQAFAWIDEWFGMTLEDVRDYETRMQQETNEKVRVTPGSEPGTPLEEEAGGSLFATPASSPAETPTSPTTPGGGKKGWFSWS